MSRDYELWVYDTENKIPPVKRKMNERELEDYIEQKEKENDTI